MCERRKLDHAEALVEEARAGGPRRRALSHRPALARDHGGVRGRPRGDGGARAEAVADAGDGGGAARAAPRRRAAARPRFDGRGRRRAPGRRAYQPR